MAADPGVHVRLPELGPSRGRVVAIVATEAAVAAGWAGQVAVELAGAWTGSGARTVLADAGIHHPQLHRTVGAPNAEGLVDALRWGASVKRVVQRPDGQSFFLITAGTAVADGGELLAGPQWPALCAGFVEAGVTLAVFVPGHDPALAGVLEQAGEVIVLAPAGEDVAGVVGARAAQVLAVLGRGSGGDPPALEPSPAAVVEPDAGTDPGPQEAWLPPDFSGAAEPEPEPFSAADFVPGDDDDIAEAAGGRDVSERSHLAGVTDDEAADPLASAAAPEPMDDGPDPEPWTDPLDPVERGDPLLGEATGAPAAYESVPTFEQIVEDTEGQAPRLTPSGGRSRGVLWILLLVLAAMAVLVAGWFGYIQIPFITPESGGASELPTQAASATLAAPPPVVEGDLLAYSLAVGSFQDENSAQGLARALSASVPGVLFVSVPLQVQGVTVHRVLAGQAGDSASALAMGSQIAAESTLDPSSWVPRPTPLAFQLGETPTAAAALRRVEALVPMGIPAYVLAVPYSDGSTRFRVYAGAFSDAAEASYLQGLLVERGLAGSPLVDRHGILPE
jgi:hypothetical protein